MQLNQASRAFPTNGCSRPKWDNCHQTGGIMKPSNRRFSVVGEGVLKRLRLELPSGTF